MAIPSSSAQLGNVVLAEQPFKDSVVSRALSTHGIRPLHLLGRIMRPGTSADILLDFLSGAFPCSASVGETPQQVLS